MADFEIAGVNYRAGKMALLDALQVARKVAPVYGRIMLVRGELAPLLEGIEQERAARQPSGDAPAPEGNMTGELFQKILGAADRLLMPILEEFARLSREDVDSIMGLCLGVCLREQPTGWAPIWNASARAPQFQDIDLPTALRIVWTVVAEQLGPFFRAPAAILTGGQAGGAGTGVSRQ